MWRRNSKWKREAERRSQGQGSSSSSLISSISEASTSTGLHDGTNSGEIFPKQAEDETDSSETMSGTQILPVETMLEIFSYLDYGDRREARRVCKRWNSIISDWREFNNNACFLLRRSPSSNTHSILNLSTVPWRNIKLNKFVATKPPTWYFPEYIHDTLTSLTFLDGSFRWSWFKGATGRFNFLENISIINCRRESEEDEGWSQTEEQFNGFLALRRRIKVLTIEEIAVDVQNLYFYLRQFTDSASILRDLKITCKCTPRSRLDELTASLANLLTSCNSSLKSIKLKGDVQFVNAVCSALDSLQTKGVLLNLDTFHLKLSDPKKRQQLNPNRDIIYTFLGSQPNLKSLVVPRIKSPIYEPLWDFFEICPKKLEKFQNSNMSIIRPVLFQLFRELKTMHIAFSDKPDVEIFVMSIDAGVGVSPELKTMKISGYPDANLIVPIIVAFPHLVKLDVSCGDHESSTLVVNDENLQMIIQSLNNLNVLRLESCTAISDAGLSGIRATDAQSLLNSKSVYLERDPSVFGMERPGLSLSSLKFLKELSLVNCNHLHAKPEISDVGIFYGLGFENLLKLNLHCGKQVSDWGLVQLGKLNPCLQYCSIQTGSTMITTAAKVMLEQGLPRAKHHLSVLFLPAPPPVAV